MRVARVAGHGLQTVPVGQRQDCARSHRFRLSCCPSRRPEGCARFRKRGWTSLWCMTRTAYHLSHVRKEPGALQSCMSAIFVYGGKLIGSKFAQPPDGGVFGSGVLRRAWYVTRTACLTRILTRTAQTVSERARQSTSQRRRRRASRAPVTVEDAVGGAGSHRSAFARSG